MESCKIVFTCNHEFNSVVSEAFLISVTKGVSDTDVLVEDGAVTEITDVYQIDEATAKIFIKGVDFEPFNYNSIKWVSDFRPVDGSVYIVEYVISKRQAISYEIEECPRCSGNGWYAALFPKDESILVSDINKTVQDFIKILFTDKQTGTGYGSNFNQLLGKPITSADDMITEVTAVINDCVVQLQNNQASAISAGSTLSDSERLLSVDLIDYEYDRVNSGITLTMSFQNAAGDSAELTFLM